MNVKTLILASKSPRRIELLEQAGFNLIICPPNMDESLVVRDDPKDLVKALALAKARAVKSSILSKEIDIPNDENGFPIVAADTVVYNNTIIGKPKDREDAMRILMDLSGKTHYVYTGVAILNTKEKTEVSFYEETSVSFKSYSPEDLVEYLDSKEPYDKAGAYGIQGYFSKFVDHISGSFTNVMGLPMEKLLELV